MSKQRVTTLLQNSQLEAVYAPTPKTVGIEITGRCQLSCRHCFNESGSTNKNELPLEVIERILDEMMIWKVHDIRLSGGEPTFHRQFKQVVNACVDRKIRITMNTHGVYNAKMIDYLKTAGIRLFLISIDGIEANNDAIRGRGVFQKVIKSVKMLNESGQKVLISFHVGTENQDDLSGLVALASDIGVDIKISLIRPIGRAAHELPHALIKPADYLHVVEKISRFRKTYPHIKILTDFDILDSSSVGDCQHDPNMASCKAGRSMVNINYDGEIYPCAFFVTEQREFSAGNVNNTSITDAWNNSLSFKPFRTHQKSAICQGCVYYKKQCFGGCPAITHFTSGYLDSHDPTCFSELVTPLNLADSRQQKPINKDCQ